MTEMDVEDQAGSGCTDSDIEGRVPMGRFATAEDVAQAIVFLADPSQSGFVIRPAVHRGVLHRRRKESSG
jgi:NAD(P)-dependent dehydrogenase (short-subunit alcohol dehydrogenase family)